MDRAAYLYTELIETSATFGEESIEKLIPHMSQLMCQLNDLSRANQDLNEEVESLKTELESTQALSPESKI